MALAISIDGRSRKKKEWSKKKKEEQKNQLEVKTATKKMQELEAKQEILQANAASAKPPQVVEIITWRADEGSEGLFKAAEIARAENQKRERKYQQRHHNPSDRRLVI
jgi:hypothetical protein